MVEFSISAVVDGFIQLGVFLLVCAAIYLLLKVVARDKFESHFFRTIAVVGAFVLGRVYAGTYLPWVNSLMAQALLLGVLVFLLALGLLKTPLPVAPLIAAAVVALGLAAEKGAAAVSKQVAPEGPTFAEYMGVAQQAIEKNKALVNAQSTDLDLKGVMRDGLDSLATLTREDELDAMKSNFNTGMALFAERKAWMDRLTLEEKRAYREEMAAFLAEQGLAGDRYSLAAIKDVNPTNLVALAGLFNELQDDAVDEETRARSIPESIAQLTANMSGFTLEEKDQATLQQFAELFGRDEMDQAVARARADLEAVKGDDEFLATLLAAMAQSGSGLPMDQLLGEPDARAFDQGSLKALAAKHWKRQGKDPEAEWRSAIPTAPVEVVEVVETAARPVMVAPRPSAPPPDPYIRVTTTFGVALVSRDDPDLHDWIAAAQAMELKGYVSLGDEVVVLRMDGAIARKGEHWVVERAGTEYRFLIHDIMNKRVTLRADGHAVAATKTAP